MSQIISRVVMIEILIVKVIDKLVKDYYIKINNNEKF